MNRKRRHRDVNAKQFFRERRKAKRTSEDNETRAKRAILQIQMLQAKLDASNAKLRHFDVSDAAVCVRRMESPNRPGRVFEFSVAFDYMYMRDLVFRESREGFTDGRKTIRLLMSDIQEALQVLVNDRVLGRIDRRR